MPNPSVCKNLATCFAASLLALLLPARAAGEVAINGFGTLGYTYNSTEEAEFIRDIIQTSGPAGNASLKTDSRFGVQLSAPINETVSATLQGLSRYDYEGKFTPVVSWAFLKYQGIPNLDLRIGRTGWDVFPISDSRDVGYSYLWARPPNEFFAKLQINAIDGLDGVYRFTVGDTLLSVKLFLGESTDKLGIDRNSYIDPNSIKVRGINLGAVLGNWTYQLSHSRLRLDLEYRGEIGRQIEDLISNGFVTASEIERLQKSEVSVYSASAAYDRGPVQVQLMLGRTDPGLPQLPVLYSGFISAGYRIGKATPYLVFALTRPESPAAIQSTPSLGSPVSDYFSNLSEDQRTLTLGVRYDFAPNWTAKIQTERIDVAEGGRNPFLWRAVSPSWDGNATVVTFTLDFIF